MERGGGEGRGRGEKEGRGGRQGTLDGRKDDTKHRLWPELARSVAGISQEMVEHEGRAVLQSSSHIGLIDVRASFV